MKRILFVLGLLTGIALCAHRADATTCTVPNTFVNGQVADAGQVNANFSALQGCGNTIDHNNIGSLGIYASQIIPTTVGQAIFGGTVAYQFSNGLTVNNGLTLGTPLTVANGGIGATTLAGASLPRVYNSGGTLVTTSTLHIVQDEVTYAGTVTCASAGAFCTISGGQTATISLLGSAAFSGNFNASCMANDGNGAALIIAYLGVGGSGTILTFQAWLGNGMTTFTNGSLHVLFTCVGT